MPQPDIIVIGASAGGLPALTTILNGLPPTLPAVVLVVMHIGATSNGVLPTILRRHVDLPVLFANDYVRPVHGHIYVARPDFHLLVHDGHLRVVHGPRENGFRPAIDPLFRTAAREFGPRVIGIVLSGALSDGTYGLGVIKDRGGITVVQDPLDAEVASMPQHALNAVDVDYVLPASEIPALLVRLSETTIQGETAMARARDLEPQLPSEETEVAAMEKRFGAPTPLTCPDCGGALGK